MKSDNHFLVEGKVIGIDTGLVSISYPNKAGKWFNDTAYLQNGHFSFKGAVDDPTHTYLFNNIDTDAEKKPEIFLEPGEITILLSTKDFSRPKVTGSHTQYELDTLNRQKEPIYSKLKVLSNTLTVLSEANNKGGTSKKLTEQIYKVKGRMKTYSTALMHKDFAFIRNHPGSYLSAYLLGAYTGKESLKDSLKIFYKSLNPEIQNSLYGQEVYAHLYTKELPIINIGDVAPNFSKTDINDHKISLSSFKGKSYVLLDFWASWCGDCLAITPHIKDLYKEYHPKGLEIIGITCDYNKAPWKAAVVKEGINDWYQIFPDPDREIGGNDLQKAYGLTFIPALFLLDKDGRVVGIYKGSNHIKDLDHKLKEALK